jgi:hypothetical protein
MVPQFSNSNDQEKKMIKLRSYSKALIGLFVVGFCISNILATEKDKEETAGKPAVTTQPAKPLAEDKVEPLGLESGKAVDKPAELADKIGKKINEFLGNKDDK